MGPFVLGVLVGWLAEWLFYTFWVKAGDNQADCSAIQAELDLKNRQISSLQSQLASVSGDTKKQTSSKSKTAALKSTTGSTSTKSAKKSTASSPKTAAKSKSKTKAATPSAAKSATKKTTASRKPSATKKAPTKTASKAKPGGDDFTKLSGIGPSMSATLKSLGIDTFNKLAATDDDILRDMLEQSGAKMNNNKEAMDSWNEQALVAATGDFKALKEMQAALKK